MNVSYIVNQRRILFIKNMSLVIPKEHLLSDIIENYIHNNEFQTLLSNCNVNFDMSKGNIKHNFVKNFIDSAHF